MQATFATERSHSCSDLCAERCYSSLWELLTRMDQSISHSLVASGTPASVGVLSGAAVIKTSRQTLSELEQEVDVLDLRLISASSYGDSTWTSAVMQLLRGRWFSRGQGEFRMYKDAFHICQGLFPSELTYASSQDALLCNHSLTGLFGYSLCVRCCNHKIVRRL